MFFGSLSSIYLLEYVSMCNQECTVKPEIVHVDSNKLLFYPFCIKTSKCSGSCNNINNTYAKLCVPDVAKKLNVKVFNLKSRTNETRYIKWYETCKCKCRLDASFLTINNAEMKINVCECKELIYKVLIKY